MEKRKIQVKVNYGWPQATKTTFIEVPEYDMGNIEGYVYNIVFDNITWDWEDITNNEGKIKKYTMCKRDREKEIKTVLNELEQLVLKAGEETERLEEEYGGDTEEYWTQEAYEAGIYKAYALCKKVFED